ncbi:MAG TPA: hypothetical protein VM661_12785 [Candidatus Sulfotelmatobacter sp.]|jgi:hypothetical protein|nr:hypothetical protein [Candidatus Sulfotelmatobacter sp.]
MDINLDELSNVLLHAVQRGLIVIAADDWSIPADTIQLAGDEDGPMIRLGWRDAPYQPLRVIRGGRS